MTKYNPETVCKFAESLQGVVQQNTYGWHTNKELAYMPIFFGNWWFASWFDFKTQTSHSPVYWFNKKPRGGFQMTIGHQRMSISEFLDLVKEIVTTNSLRIESRKKYIECFRD